MDEGHEGNGHRARPSDEASRRVEIHQVNDFVVGHVGQISYKPVADDDVAVGDLSFGRMDEHPPSFQQLVSFEEWFAPTRTRLPLPPSTTFQRNKSQKNWLFKTHPEAFLGNLDLLGLISEETRHETAGRKGIQTGSLLAIGEIFDSKNTGSSRTATCPVIALAAGEAGHILQLSAISAENWSWNDASFAVGAPQRKFHGSWCSDGSPISKIEFVTKLKPNDTIRWLIAQKETSTTIFEPELKARPAVGTALRTDLDDGPSDHIVLNPVTALTTDITGGESHCDFSVNLGSNDLAPQLAVIDKFGNWSVWYLSRDGRGRSRRTKAMLMKKGSWAFPGSVPLGPDRPFGEYKIVWATRSSTVDEWERDNSPAALSDPFNDGAQAAYLAQLDASRTKYDSLMMCNHTQLQILDVDEARLPSWLDFSRRDGKDTILDAQTFYGASSYAFVLTTDKLYLLDVSLLEGQEAKSPHILGSYRHFRNDPRETLKLSITKVNSAFDEASALVSLHSAHSFRVDVFCVIVNQRDRTAKLHRQILHFPGLETADTGKPQGIESLAAVALHLAPLKGKGRQKVETDSEGFAYTADTQLYQLFALTADLSLSSSIVALMSGFQHNLAKPVKGDGLGWNAERQARFLRRKWLRETEQAFIVPDKAEVIQPLSVVHVTDQAQKLDAVQLRYYLLKLVKEINKAYIGDAAEASANFNATEHFKSIRGTMKYRKEDDHIALKPLLSFSNLWLPLDLSILDDAWGSNVGRLSKFQQTQSFECGTYGPKLSVMDLFEKMSINWSATLPAEALKASQWRYMELALERMAAEVHMSERAIFMVPQSTLDLASKSVPQDEAQVQGDLNLSDLPSSQPRSSQLLPTPSATPSSSRATSEAVNNTINSKEDDETILEDPAVARLRMYLPFIKFTPPPKAGPSRVISLWPEQRGVDPYEYRHRFPGQGPDEKAEARKRRREREEQRRRRRAEKVAQLGFKIEGAGESYSQPYRATMMGSSPPPQGGRSSQHQLHSQGFVGFRFGPQSQSQSFSQGFDMPQTMSQPLPGEFGARARLKKGKGKAKVSAPGFK